MHMLGWRQDWKRLADVVAPPSPNALDSSVAAASVASPASPGGASVGSKDNAADDARETGIEGDQEEQEDDAEWAAQMEEIAFLQDTGSRCGKRCSFAMPFYLY
jgi:hypothetical protein